MNIKNIFDLLGNMAIFLFAQEKTKSVGFSFEGKDRISCKREPPEKLL